MTHETLKRKAEQKLSSELETAREKYEEEWLQETCEILTDAGEFESVEECKKEGVEEAKRISREWVREWTEETAEYLK
ncbi:hypothetical protein AKJ56_01145 [candidate division MSBL1 archaeon SCGC-AAA382N08]|uniref:Uncharacterized protein n=1 Tax=candidate division MSBL1 archaeon SCGC-AAA382N08 TaxID=1698285 RepID=A0A133VPZ9_9EURY|nr:hypothetical protein AKJ56_01145 [candidate division MSBL1 archaeon SCGC-AAA382N08]